MDYYFPLFLEASSQFGYSDLRRIDFSGIQYFTGDVSGMPFSIFSFGMAICNFSFWADGWKFTQVQANNFAGAIHLDWTLNHLLTAGRLPGFA